MKSRVAIALFLYICSIISCSMDPKVAGGVDDTGNFLTGVVASSDLTPAASQEVQLKEIIISSSGDSVVREWSATTDYRGTYTFNDIPDGRFSLVCYDNTARLSGILSRIDTEQDSIHNLDNMVIDNHITLRGRILSSSSINYLSMTVCIPGIGMTTHPDNDGFYILSDIPKGQYDLTFVYQNTVNYLPVKTSNYSNDTVYIKDFTFAMDEQNADRQYSFFPYTQSDAFSVFPEYYAPDSIPSWYTDKDFTNTRYFRFDTNDDLFEIGDDGSARLLIDDFEDGDDLTFLNAVTHLSYWFAYNDSLDGGNSVVGPAGTIPDFTPCLTTVDSYKGTCAHATFLLGGAFQLPYANIGFELDTAYVDMTNLKSISFYAKGSGTIRVNFESEAVLSYPHDWWYAHLGYELTLPSDWQKITIPVDSIKVYPGTPPADDGLTWDSIKNAIEQVEFGIWQTAGKTAELWIDDIYLDGLTAEDFQ